MAARGLWAMLVLGLCGCAVQTTPVIAKIALLAPFEGEYREIGYNALYAARLGITDDALSMDLLAIDDGGTIPDARSRAQAIALDPQITGVLLLGPFATDSSVQEVLAPLPTVIVGNWQATPSRNHSIQLARADRAVLQLPAGEFTLTDESAANPGMWRMQSANTTLAFWSSGALPDADYTARYRALGEFTPTPNVLATLTTDAVRLLTASYTQSVPLAELDISLLNGHFTFAAGYWVQAPAYLYQYATDGTLTVTHTAERAIPSSSP